MSVTETHEVKETLVVEVNVPGHDARVATSLFKRTKKLLIERDGERCYVCNRTPEQSGHPLESHHHPIERSMANMIDWTLFMKDAKAGKSGPHAQAFDWDKFDPNDPMTFVDDQTVNGILLCKDHHTGMNQGIHDMPYPLWIAQKYGKEGYVFSDHEVIHHAT